jgi:hypothetical protein
VHLTFTMLFNCATVQWWFNTCMQQLWLGFIWVWGPIGCVQAQMDPHAQGWQVVADVGQGTLRTQRTF